MPISPVLTAESLGKKYGKHWVLQDADLRLYPGQITALMGENGAGKSTLMKILSGAIFPSLGSVSLNGKVLPPGNPLASRNAGIGIVYQELSICPEMSVADNILLGQFPSTLGWLKLKHARQRIRQVLDQLGHPELSPDVTVGKLSVGAQQLVEIARALMQDARVLILDEPTSSLPAEDVRRLFDAVKRLAAGGLAVIYVSHFLEEIRRLCDSYLVLRDGRVAGQGKLQPDDAPPITDDQIVRLMVGRDVDELFPTVPHQPGEPMLEIKNLSGKNTSPGDVAPDAVSMTVCQGEILGVTGLIGAGRTEMLRAVAGLDPSTGTVRLQEQTLRGSPRSRIRRGLAMLSENRKEEGLATGLSIRDNITLSRLAAYSMGGLLNESARNRAADILMRRMQVKATDIHQPVGQLSGGNQQKVAIARTLHQMPQCLLLDEPTRGIDVGTKSEIYRLIGELAAEGKSIIFVSSYFTELLKICDRIAVFERGKLVAIKPASEWDEESILKSAMGS